ncbi:N-acetyltransferase [Gordonia spumicola]|uniref:N-acetyltransferase n=1 Tax=Gordonia spumicola TaxID=589161 RepID=A0A7I9V2J8_9ACTN|nr:GNAT family N-acetyltransferase [Gordonia spumicola]GED99647.1 N-acetyltransferase [Gordonia spumicola]
MADGTISVKHLAERERYRADITGDDGEQLEVGYVDYTQDGDRVALTHTVVYERFGGRGFAADLVKYVLDDVRTNNQTVVPVCSYVVKYLEKHPEYSDLVAS